MSVVRAEVLVEGFPADVELAGKLRLGLAGRRSLPQGSSLLIGQGFLCGPGTRHAAWQGDALTLPLADQGALELSEGPITDSIRLAIGESSPVNTEALLQELDAHAALESASVPSDAGHRGCGPADPCCAPPLYRLRGRSSAALRAGALGVLARCLVGEHLAHLGLFQLAFRVLVKAADPDVADAVPCTMSPWLKAA